MSIFNSKDTSFNSEDNPRLPYRTILEALAAAQPDKPFVTMWSGEDNVQAVTFGEFTAQAKRQAARFRAHGLKQGDTLILIMPQGIALMAAFVGAMMIGAVPAILAYPNFKVEPGKYRIGLAGVTANLNARAVILDAAFPQEFLAHVDLKNDTLLLRDEDRSDNSDGDVTAAFLEQSTAFAALDTNADSIAFIQHSAGTTGLQKGVALSHAAVLRQLGHLINALNIGEEDRIYSWLPLYHDMGLIACFMLPLVGHVPLVMQSPTDWVMQPGTMLQIISEHKCTLAWAPNFTLQFLARRVHPDDRAGYDLSSLRAFVNCSEPVRAQSMDEFIAAYASSGLSPTALQSSYAMAENVFAVTQSNSDAELPRVRVDSERLRIEHIAVPVPAATDDAATSFVSSGKCLPGNRVRIVSSNGEALPDGAIGEILIRSDSLFDGYFNRADLTAKVLEDGWYKSGDLGFCLDEELYVIGRQKDLIIVAGKNIYPQDVEEIVYGHPAIHDGRAVAFGFYNDSLGTEDIIVVAEVEDEEKLNDAFAVERAVRGAIVAELGVAVRALYLKPPKWIVKSTAGKPARAITRDKLIAEHPELGGAGASASKYMETDK